MATDPIIQELIELVEPPEQGHRPVPTSGFGRARSKGSTPHVGFDVNRGRGVQTNGRVTSPVYGEIGDIDPKLGRPNRPPRPWLGLYVTEAGPRLVVAGLAADGPADKAGVKVGDAVLEVAGAKPASLADVFRRIWACGTVGARVSTSQGSAQN